MTTAARAGQFTGATDNAAKGGLFTDSKIDGIPDLVAADVASAQTSATTATTQAATATTQATTATTKATEAAASATAAASSATAANQSALQSANSATVATSATSSVNTNATNAAASETAAATSATNAAASASTASTQATNATTQANSALSSASAASTSATNASNSATTATNYATKVNGAVTGTDFSSKAWAIGGTNVTDTAGRGAAKEWAIEAEDNTVDGTNYSALHHAAKAAASATNAANTLDSFDDRYLGVKSSDPSADNDGDSLATGALYFKTGDGLKVYNGSAWDDLKPTATEQNNINSLAGILDGTKTYAVTVTNPGSGNVFVLDGVNAPALTLVKGFTYTFDVSNGTVGGHPLAFKDSGGNAYTTGVTVSGSAGNAGATVVLAIPKTGTMPARYYCTAHGNAMGNTITVEENDIATVASISTEIGEVAAIDSNVTTVAGNNSNVTTVAGISANVTSVAGVAANVTTVAGIASNVTTVATNNSNVSTVAGSISNVNTAAGSISNINTTAGAISNVNTVASNITDVNSFANRYRIQSGEPSSSLDEGDLVFDSATGVKVLKYYNGSAWVEVAANTKGIGNGNVAEFTTGVADDDFLRINGTKVEGRSSSEVLSDIGGTTATAAADEATALAIALG